MKARVEMAEPQWPTADIVIKQFDPNFLPSTDMLVTFAISECRAAWLATWDDPRQSAIGEVRRSPEGLIVALQEASGWPWAAITGCRPNHSHSEVVGWPVIGQVPGTPAAEQDSR
jgi:hypothetical protein